MGKRNLSEVRVVGTGKKYVLEELLRGTGKRNV